LKEGFYSTFLGARKVAKEIVEGKSKGVLINAENLKHYLPK